MNALFDTNILIDHLNGIEEAMIEMRRAVQIRKTARIKLPDALIWASAQAHSMLLVTRNTKDFSASEPGVRIPYQLKCYREN